VPEAINYMKKIKFEETKVIVSGKLYNELVTSFKKNIIYMCFTPKLIVFTRNKEDFIKNNKEYEKNSFYNFGGIATTFKEIKKFLNIYTELVFISQLGEKPRPNYTFQFEEINSDKDKNDNIQLTFEYIDNLDKLKLPLFFKSLIDDISNENIEEYTNLLFDEYSKNSKNIKKLFDSIESISNIPIEILSKYYARLYTINSDFQKDLNKDLRLNKIEKYLPFIKIFYEGVKLKSLPLTQNNILYRGAQISKDEINKIKDYIIKKKDGLPSSIVFSKSFLSFSKSEKEAKKFLKNNDNNKNLSKVMFILEKNDNIEYNLATHGDIENISFYPEEKKVLFFPFSSFEIKNIKEIKFENDNGYQIDLLYLGKYLKKIKNDKNMTQSEDKLPDSEFKRQLSEFGLIKKEKIENVNSKVLYNSFEAYEKKIDEIKIPDNNIDEKKENINKKNNEEKNGIINNEENSIIGEINIQPFDKYKNIQIINSFENVQKKTKKK